MSRRGVARLGGALCVMAATGLALSAREDPPEEPSALRAATSAAANIGRGARTSNVVPATFRAQLVVDDRFKAAKKDAPDAPDVRDRTGKMHCLVCEYGLSPVVAVFVGPKADLKGETAGLVKLIEDTHTLTTQFTGDKLSAFTMFLLLDGGEKAVEITDLDGTKKNVSADLEYPDDEKRDVKAAAVKTFATPVKAPMVPFGLAATSSTVSRAFGIAEDVPVTVVIYNRLRITQRWELKLDDLNGPKGEATIKEILEATKAMIKARQPKKD